MNDKPGPNVATAEHTYLGDGVYVRADGWVIWLSVGQQQSIALEPDTYEQLVRYGARMGWVVTL